MTQSPSAFSRVLITGVRGSAGSYLAEYIVHHHPSVEVHGVAQWHSTTHPRLDPALLRPADVTLQIPSVDRFVAATAWQPRYSFEQSLSDLLDYWRRQARAVADAGLPVRSALSASSP